MQLSLKKVIVIEQKQYSIYYKLVENDIGTINCNPSTEIWIDVPIDKKIAIHRNKFGAQCQL